MLENMSHKYSMRKSILVNKINNLLLNCMCCNCLYMVNNLFLTKSTLENKNYMWLYLSNLDKEIHKLHMNHHSFSTYHSDTQNKSYCYCTLNTHFGIFGNYKMKAYSHTNLSHIVNNLLMCLYMPYSSHHMLYILHYWSSNP